MRLLVVGAGAVGGYFGMRLAQAGRDVTFLVRSRRAEQLRSDGLRVASLRGDLRIEPQIEVTGALARTYDAVLLAVKAYALEDAMRDLAPAVGPTTMIVPFLNGMRHLDVLVARFGESAVLGGVSMVATQIEPDGLIRQLGEGASLLYGERAGGTSARVEALDAALRDAGFDASSSPRILAEMWRKWIMLATAGALTCLMRGTVGDVEAAGGTPTVERIFAECSAVAAASGYPPAPEVAAGLIGMLTKRGSNGTSSMYRDLIAGNAIEGEHIIADMVARGEALGVPTPLLEATRTNLRVYSAGQAAR
jgi:2-dehydropantoate 2-reductase